MAALDGEHVRQTSGEIRELGRESLALPTDITDLAQIQRMVDGTVEKFGKVDILANVAGIWIPRPALDMSEAEWDRTMNVNLKGAFFAAQAAARDMIKRGRGSIVSISSIDATVTPPEQVHYTASKAGISAMTRCLAIEWGGHGIRVNAIAPGWVLTDMTREALEQDGEAVLARIPAGRVARPEDIAKLALFLVSSQAEYIMGAVVDINGGLGLML